MVDAASVYVDKVVAGEVSADDETGRRIADTLASVPRIRPEVLRAITSVSRAQHTHTLTRSPLIFSWPIMAGVRSGL